MYRVLLPVLALLLAVTPAAAQSEKPRAGGPRPSIAPIAPPTTTFRSKYGKGTIIVDTQRRRLLYVLSKSKAYLYPVSVGRQGFQWSGTERITAKKNWPTWRPPAEMRQRQPNLPVVMSGGLYNPLGAKALYLGSSLYRIHGTSNTRGIGSANSSGCIRMHNAHVTHLARLAKIGTKVVVLKALPNRVARSFANKSTSSIKIASANRRSRRKPDLSWRRAVLGN
ncbi:MAG: L,D-transpeptidase [Hyphomicrobiaceae bacterium]